MAYKYKVNALSYIGDTHQQSENCFFVDGITPLSDGVCNGANITTTCKGKKHLFAVFSAKVGLDRVCNRLEDALMKKNNKKIRSKVQFELKNIMEEISGTICRDDTESEMSMVYIEGNNLYASGHGDINIYTYTKKHNEAKKIEFPLYTHSHLSYENGAEVAVKVRQPARSKCISKVTSGKEFLLVDSNLVSVLGDEQILEILKEYGPNAPAKLIENASLAVSAYNLTAVHISVKKKISPLYFIIPALLIVALGTYAAFPQIMTGFKEIAVYEPEEGMVSESDANSALTTNDTVQKIKVVESDAKTDTLSPLAPLSVQLDIIGGEVTGQNSRVSYYVKDLSTGIFIESKNSAMSSASLIKLYIMAEIYRQVSVNELEMNDTIKDLMHKMITISDNDASNELAKIAGDGDMELGFQRITENAKSLGCINTEQVNDLQANRTTSVAKSNTTSVCDCGLLLEKIYNKTLVSEEYSGEMLEMLKQQTRTGKIPKYIPDDVVVANKTGETSIAQNDVGIVFVKDKPYIICIMINHYENTMDEAMEIVAKMSKAAYDFFTQEP